MVYMHFTLAVIVLSSIFDNVNASCGHGTYLHRRVTNLKRRQEGEAPVKTVEVKKFGYIGTQGPTQWAALSPENIGCATNTVQSPIDLTNQTTTTVAPGTLQINFVDVASTEFENIGTTVEVVMEGKGSTTVAEGKTFELKQFHFHSPSEHTVDGEYFPLEVHFVHEAEDQSIAVIAAQFQLSEGTETTELIKGIVEKIGEISTAGTVTETAALAFGPLVDALKAQPLLSYTGSLTTPPCAEGLKFFVTTQQLPLDVATFNKLKAVVGFNARFLQNAPGSPNLLSLAPAVLIAGDAAPPVVASGEVAASTSAATVEATATALEGEIAVSTGEAESASATSTIVAEATATAVAESKAVEEVQPVTGEVPAAGRAKVSTVSATSESELNEIVKDLTGIDLDTIL